jgi:hypothetical protein
LEVDGEPIYFMNGNTLVDNSAVPASTKQEAVRLISGMKQRPTRQQLTMEGPYCLIQKIRKLSACFKTTTPEDKGLYVAIRA